MVSPGINSVNNIILIIVLDLVNYSHLYVFNNVYESDNSMHVQKFLAQVLQT